MDIMISTNFLERFGRVQPILHGHDQPKQQDLGSMLAPVHPSVAVAGDGAP